MQSAEKMKTKPASNFLVFAVMVAILIMTGCQKEDSCSFFSQGKGTKKDPYLIFTTAEFNSIRQCSGKFFKQAADISLSDFSNGSGWLPIERFSGGFDGNGFKIFDLMINQPENEILGLFGELDNAIVKNVSIIDANITAKNRAGTLAGKAWNDSRISNCHATGTILSASGVECGGLVALVHDSEIQQSSAFVDIHAVVFNAGGLIAFSNRSAIKECFAGGNITVMESGAGGLISSAHESVISDCYATGRATSGTSVAGGLIASSEKGTIIKNSYAIGLVSVTESHGGGLVGFSHGTAIYESYWNLETTGQQISSGSDYLSGKLTSEMKQSSTYPQGWAAEHYGSAWDFDKVWDIRENETYPFFRWQEGRNLPD